MASLRCREHRPYRALLTGFGRCRFDETDRLEMINRAVDEGARDSPRRADRSTLLELASDRKTVPRRLVEQREHDPLIQGPGEHRIEGHRGTSCPISKIHPSPEQLRHREARRRSVANGLGARSLRGSIVPTANCRTTFHDPLLHVHVPWRRDEFGRVARDQALDQALPRLDAALARARRATRVGGFTLDNPRMAATSRNRRVADGAAPVVGGVALLFAFGRTDALSADSCIARFGASSPLAQLACSWPRRASRY